MIFKTNRGEVPTTQSRRKFIPTIILMQILCAGKGATIDGSGCAGKSVISYLYKLKSSSDLFVQFPCIDLIILKPVDRIIHLYSIIYFTTCVTFFNFMLDLSEKLEARQTSLF